MRYRRPVFWLTALLLCGIAVWSRHDEFFWDTISQASVRSTWFYAQRFATPFLPPELDSGHPPLFNWYVAGGWVVFGRTLPVSHLLMVPLLLVTAWQWQRLFDFLRKQNPGLPAWVALIPLIDTTLLAQAGLVSADLAMLACALTALNAVLRKQEGWLFAALAPLGLLSLRGLPAAAALGLFWLMQRLSANDARRPLSLRALWPWLGAAAVWALWFGAHYAHTGWWLSTPNPRWNAHRHFSGIAGLAWNAGITGWRLLDYGRLAWWLLLALLVFRKGFGRWLWAPLPRYVLCFLAVHAAAMWPVSNPITHRYFLPVLLLMPLWVGIEAWQAGGRFRKWGLPFMAALLLSGHLWVYPRGIAQGWDGTTAHWPWYGLRRQMLQLIEREGIAFSAVGTRFPNAGPFDKFDLSGRTEGLPRLDWQRHRYVFYSNVMNDFSDEELARLDSLPVRHRLEKGGICVILYENTH